MLSASIAASREAIVPAFRYGSYHAASTQQLVGEFMPTGKMLLDEDSRRANALTVLNEIRAVYGRDGILSVPYSYGLIESIEYASSVLLHSRFESAVIEITRLLETRLSALDDIEAVFYSHAWTDSRKVMVNQNGKPVSDGEIFAFAFRRGLKYALSKVQSCDTERPVKRTSRYLSLPSLLMSFGCFAREQTNWVRNELPVLRKAYIGRPSFHDVDLLSSGWSYGSKLVEQVTGQPSYCGNTMRRFTEEPELCHQLLLALRADSMCLHMFRLGFGRAELSAKTTNGVFNQSIDPKRVALEDVLEVVQMFCEAGKTSQNSETWLSN